MVSRTVKKVLITSGATLLTSGLVSMLYQKICSASDNRRFPAPGQMVDIGGRRLHVMKAGLGPVTVVILPSLGACGLEWLNVQKELLDDATVYLVDRGGLGWSEPARGPRTPSVLSDELEQLVSALEINKPFILIGHSYGGVVARLYAARNPGRLAGLMLVDSSHEDQYQELDKLDPTCTARNIRINAMRHQIRWLGFRRILVHFGFAKSVATEAKGCFPSEMIPAGTSRLLTTAHRKAVVQELLGLASRMHDVRKEAQSLGSLPLTVLTGGPAGREQMHPAWLELQKRLTTMSTNCVQVMALHAGHYVNQDDPKLLANAVKSLIRRTKVNKYQTISETSPLK